MVLLPQALRPVNQITQPLCLLSCFAFRAGDAVFVPRDVGVVCHVDPPLLNADKMRKLKRLS